MTSNTPGRPKGGIWDYFSYDEKEGHSVCMVKKKSRTEEQNDNSLGSKTFKGKLTTNLKLHLKKNMLKSTSSLKRKRRKGKETTGEKPKVMVVVQIHFYSKQTLLDKRKCMKYTV